jgi:RimJ/RimL family protein N-acetyltransferase
VISIRPASADDRDFLVALLEHEQVEPFLAGRRADVDAELARTQESPDAYARMVIEVDGRPAGTLFYERRNERSRIAHLGGLAVHPDYRGRGVADRAARLLQQHLFALGYHRLELEVYGFNNAAMRHAERAGFVREGVKRKAYLRHGDWVDGVLYALLPEDLAGTE